MFDDEYNPGDALRWRRRRLNALRPRRYLTGRAYPKRPLDMLLEVLKTTGVRR